MKKAKEFILKMETPSSVRECCSPSSPNALPSPLVYSGSANYKLIDNRRGWLSSDELLSDSPGQHKQAARPTLAANSKPETPPHAPPCALNPLTQKHGPIHADYPTVDQFVSDDGRTCTSHSDLKQTYRSTFKTDWSLKWPYISRSPSGDPYVFFCNICKKTLSCAHQGIRDVTRHLESSGHLDKMNLSTKLPPDHQDILSGNRSLQALRDSGELSVVKTPPLDDDSDQDGDNGDNSPPPNGHALQASQALAAVDGRLNPALKDVQCPICYKVFSRKFSLEMHFLIHQGLKPYTCEHCGRSFRQKGTLMRHTAIHNQTPSYRCGLCDRSYRQKNVFLHHLRTRHKISTDMLDRRRSKGGAQDETGSSHSFLESISPSGTTETVYPPPESPESPELSEHQDSMPVRPLSAEPVTSTLPNHPSPFPAPNPASVPMPMPLPSGPFPNSLFLPNFLPFPTMGFPAQTGRAVSPQNSWRCPFCPFETLSEDTEDWRKHLLHHLSDTPHSCLSCGQRCANEADLFAHIQDCHAAGRGALNISSVLQAAVNKLSHTLLVLCAFQLSG